MKSANILESFADLRLAGNAPALSRFSYAHQVPALPTWMDKIYYYKAHKINLFKLTCTCQTYSNNSAIYQGRDIRKLCKHIYYKLINRDNYLLDSLTKSLIKSAIFYNIEHFFKYSYKNKNYYFGFKQSAHWIDVWVNLPIHNNDNYVRFSYNPLLHRWSSNIPPANNVFLELIVLNLIKNHLPFVHPEKAIYLIKKSV